MARFMVDQEEKMDLLSDPEIQMVYNSMEPEYIEDKKLRSESHALLDAMEARDLCTVITRSGKPVAAIIPFEFFDCDRLQDAQIVVDTKRALERERKRKMTVSQTRAAWNLENGKGPSLSIVPKNAS